MNLLPYLFIPLFLLPVSTTTLNQTKLPPQTEFKQATASDIRPVVKTLYSSATTTPSQLKIAKIFGDKMLPVINCESGFNQFNSEGKPLISPTNDVGIMQLNRVHWKRAEELGLDIFYSENDNILMGKIVYEEEGIEAWTCSRLLASP